MPSDRPDGTLVQVSGSPFSLSGSANGPGPLLVDPYGNNVYVLGTALEHGLAAENQPDFGELDGIESGDRGHGLAADVDGDSRG